MIEYGSETYLTASEVAARFKISRGTCSTNVLRHVQACYLPGRRKALYRQSEVEQLAQVRIVVASEQGVPLAAKPPAHPA